MARSRTRLSDFQDFIHQGNVVVLALAVVIGAAFGQVGNAVVSLLLGSLRYSDSRPSR